MPTKTRPPAKPKPARKKAAKRPAKKRTRAANQNTNRVDVKIGGSGPSGSGGHFSVSAPAPVYAGPYGPTKVDNPSILDRRLENIYSAVRDLQSRNQAVRIGDNVVRAGPQPTVTTSGVQPPPLLGPQTAPFNQTNQSGPDDDETIPFSELLQSRSLFTKFTPGPAEHTKDSEFEDDLDAIIMARQKSNQIPPPPSFDELSDISEESLHNTVRRDPRKKGSGKAETNDIPRHINVGENVSFHPDQFSIDVLRQRRGRPPGTKDSVPRVRRTRQEIYSDTQGPGHAGSIIDFMDRKPSASEVSEDRPFVPKTPALVARGTPLTKNVLVAPESKPSTMSLLGSYDPGFIGDEVSESSNDSEIMADKVTPI